MTDVPITEAILEMCFQCGRRFPAKGVYDFYCSSRCRVRGERWIEELAEDYAATLSEMEGSP